LRLAFFASAQNEFETFDGWNGNGVATNGGARLLGENEAFK
jgi:hypothetical protein